MNRFYFFIVVLFILTVSCNHTNESEEKDYAQLILGTWVCDSIDQDMTLTNNIFIMKFNEDMTAVYGDEEIYADKTTEWKEISDFTYHLEKNILYIEGTHPQGYVIYLELFITNITETHLYYYIQKSLVNGGLVIIEPKIFKLTKSQKNLAHHTGIWHGGKDIQISNGYDLYWDLRSDHYYDFYYYDIENNQYVFKTDNNGNYFDYGNYIVLNCTNLFNQPVQGKTHQIWHIIESDENHMIWQGKRTNGVITSFRLERSNILPIIGKGQYHRESK